MNPTTSNLIRAGQFAQAARQAAVIVVALALPRLGVAREVIGEWESLLYVGYILGFGWLTGLLQGYLVNIRLTRPAEAARFSRLAIGSVAAISALLLLVAAGLHEPLFRLLRLGNAPAGWGFFFLFLLTQWPGLFFEQVLMVRGKALALALFGGLSALGFILAMLLPLYYGAGLEQALLVLAAFAGGKGLVILGWTIIDYLKVPQIDGRSVRPLASEASIDASLLRGRGAGGAAHERSEHPNAAAQPANLPTDQPAQPHERSEHPGAAAQPTNIPTDQPAQPHERSEHPGAAAQPTNLPTDQPAQPHERSEHPGAAAQPTNIPTDQPAQPHERSEHPGAAAQQPNSPTAQSLWLKTSLPLILYASVGALVTAFDPWFVNFWYNGDEAIFATFRYGARELPLLAAITNGAMVVVLPRLTEDPSAGLDLLKSSSRRLFHWIFGGAILLMLTSPWWWTTVFTEVFAESLPLFRVYLFIVVSRLLFPTPVLTALGYTRMLAPIAISELVCNLLFSLALVPYFGLAGIIWATVLADILNKGVLMAYLQRRTGITPKRYIDGWLFLGYCGALGIAYFAVS